MNVHHHSYDAVIVGAGGAGLRAAIEVAGKCRVAVLTKLYPTRSHTGAAQGGMCAALANVEEDSWEWHAFDTVKGGDYLGDQPAIEIMCQEAIDAVVELEHFGLPFNRTPEGKIDQRRFGGHTRNHGEAAGAPGLLLGRPHRPHDPADPLPAVREAGRHLLQRVPGPRHGLRRRPSGPAGRRVAGVIAYEMATGDLHVFPTKAVLFATGGFGRMFKISSNAVSLTGDGPGLLYRRGIPMQDMEFFQFHPTGIYKLGILLSEAARGEGGILRNVDGERFMERYAPTVKDLAPRDMVSRSIMTEIREGRGVGATRTCVYLDLTHLPPEQIDEKLPDITDFVRTYLGIEPKKDPIPIQPTAHYAMGGIPTNVDGQVVIDADNTVLPGPLRRRRVRLRVGARRQPAGHQLAARHRRVRPAGRQGHGPLRRRRRPARAARGPRGRGPGPHREDEGRQRHGQHRRPARPPPGRDDRQRHRSSAPRRAWPHATERDRRADRGVRAGRRSTTRARSSTTT